MKKNTAVTIGLIIFLSAVLVIKNYGCGSKAPVLEGWYEPADRIVVKGKDIMLDLTRKENSWSINEQGYPGDPDLIGSLERKARDFKLLDLVSNNGYYDRYDLTDEKGISVIIEGKGKMLRKILIGKSGPTNNHSYVRIDDRKEIYLASGIMQSDFRIPAADLRNRAIFDIKAADIKSFSISYAGKKFEFRLKPDESSSAAKNIREDDTAKNKKVTSKWICKGNENLILNDQAVNSILSVFSPLRAAEFPENSDRKSAGGVICKVTITSADKKIELEILSHKNKEMNYAASTESRYLFTLGSWQTERLFIKNINDLTVK